MNVLDSLNAWHRALIPLHKYTDAFRWCENKFGGYRYMNDVGIWDSLLPRGDVATFLFEQETDAVFFKLTWG